MKLANFNDLNNWGIIETINNDFLHQLGLKLIIDNDGKSPGCLISDDLYFPKTHESETKKKFNTFIKNRYYYLKNYIEIKETQKEINDDVIKKITQINEQIKEQKILKTENDY